MATTWYYNSTNEEKIREVQHLFSGSQRLRILRHPIIEILDTDLERVVLAKAADAYRSTRMPVIVEHGALCIDFLNGIPGALVKPTWMALGNRLCTLVPTGQPRTSRARSALCYCDGRRRVIILKEVEGELAPEPRGTGGFHWDPVFIPKGDTRTLAELPLDEKLRVSASGQAFAELRQKLGL
ncbi:non-canonical purine NTP pyrophosphatase [Hyalangium rubrum]|uniref:Non-canonical purine NTP pyrophosphatase n=1 Tax=Hyalangium rubrum TaxID=3103134 RepID=A0ABU5HC61_9BACT|nr:non-canonical purine NTP pyrophosphatase [Hyalangium sp. s54d21]MDY7230851.1 non-canonical purine NTP pyrophosphatase [Hyalangium sp. s54d21]